jgi:quinol monooxygenase YgiN
MQEESNMIKRALFVRLEAKPGKEQSVADFLATGLEIMNQEATTPIWFALKLSPTTFGIFDAFANDENREAHLQGILAEKLMARVDELLTSAPLIERIDVLGMKNKLG